MRNNPYTRKTVTVCSFLLACTLLMLSGNLLEARIRVYDRLYRQDLLIGRQDTVTTRRDTVKTRRDTLKNHLDTLKIGTDTVTARKDTLSVRDSIPAGDSVQHLYTERELRKMYRDSVRAVRDSIRWAKPRLLETGFLPDSLYFKRILVWNTGKNVNEFRKTALDTTFNDWYCEYPYFREDVDVNYLGTVGSPTQNMNFLKRREFNIFKAYAPYLVYSYTPDNMPFYNTKSPYTELAYWGTLFAYKDKEEINVRFLHTQNITPELNLSMLVQRWGTKGWLTNENTQNNNFHFNLNYLGKRYVGHLGYIHQNIDRQENGGIQDSFMVRDTTVKPKTIPITLNKASNTLSRNTVFINHSYDISLRSKRRHAKDTLPKQPDSTFLAGADSTLLAGAPADSTVREELGDGPMITLGHVGELSRFYRFYRDNIPMNDRVGREFYHNRFYIDPLQSADSTRLFTVENRLYFKIQPWARDGVVNQITGGVGHQWNNIYAFNPDMFLRGNSNFGQNNFYVYAGVGGEYRKYLNWGASAKYQFLGYYQNDLDIDAFVDVSFYPFRKNRKEPVTLSGRFSTTLTEPDWFSQRYYSNHYIWNNHFGKTSTTKVEAMLNIPKWNFELGFGYGLVSNYLYNDTQGQIRQHGDLLNVMTGYLKKNFKVWILRFDHRVLFQYSSNRTVLPLPMFTFHFRYYFEFVAVKNALTIQLGADATMNTRYYAPAYNPALGTFQLQDRELIGNNPYIDIFLNLQWKRVNIFLKCINVGQGWPNGDMFSAYHYVKPYRAFKIGIHWPFYFK